MSERTKLGLASVAYALSGYATLGIGVWILTNGGWIGWIWVGSSALWLVSVYFRSTISYSRGGIEAYDSMRRHDTVKYY